MRSTAVAERVKGYTRASWRHTRFSQSSHPFRQNPRDVSDDRTERRKRDQGKWKPAVTRKEKAPQNEGPKVAATGLEHNAEPPEKHGAMQERGAESGAPTS